MSSLCRYRHIVPIQVPPRERARGHDRPSAPVESALTRRSLPLRTWDVMITAAHIPLYSMGAPEPRPAPRNSVAFVFSPVIRPQRDKSLLLSCPTVRVLVFGDRTDTSLTGSHSRPRH